MLSNAECQMPNAECRVYQANEQPVALSASKTPPSDSVLAGASATVAAPAGAAAAVVALDVVALAATAAG